MPIEGVLPIQPKYAERNQVLSILYALVRERVNVSVQAHSLADQYGGHIEQVDILKGAIRLALISKLPEDVQAVSGIRVLVKKFYPLLGFDASVLSVGGDQVLASIPDRVNNLEKRKFPRVQVYTKDHAGIIVSTGVSEGIVVHGSIFEISESGCSFVPSRAVDIRSSRSLDADDRLAERYRTAVDVRINLDSARDQRFTGRLLKCNTVQGECRYVVTFDSVPRDLRLQIRALISKRLQLPRIPLYDFPKSGIMKWDPSAIVKKNSDSSGVPAGALPYTVVEMAALIPQSPLSAPKPNRSPTDPEQPAEIRAVAGEKRPNQFDFLIIDDTAAALDIKEILQYSRKCRAVYIVPDYDEARRIFGETECDVVFSEILGAPDEALAALKKFAPARVVVATGNPTQETILRLVLAGFREIIVKPVEEARVEKILESLAAPAPAVNS